MKNHSRQRGSAFFIILIAISLFAALSYAVSQGSRVSIGQLGNDQAKLAAQEIISYGNTIATSVEKLRLKGCAADQIGFASHNGMSQTTDGTPYVYNTGPADGSCDVFNGNGGKVTPSFIKSGMVPVESALPGIMSPKSFIITATRVAGVGSEGADGTDLLLWVGRLTEQTCIAVNDLLGIPNPGGKPPIDTFDCQTYPFDGTYPACSDPIGDTATVLKGKTSFCNQAFAGDPLVYIYHQVLFAR